MAPALKTSVTELPESRVRVSAEVPSEEVERQLTRAASALGRQMRIPGFRKGKVPPPVIIRRVGPRGGARRGGPRVARALVRRGGRRGGDRPGRRPQARPRRAARARASRSPSRSRSACARRAELGDYKRPRGRAARARGRRRGRRPRARGAARADGQARVRRAAGADRRLRRHRLRGEHRRRAVRRRRGAATSCSSSARAAWSRASRSSSSERSAGEDRTVEVDVPRRLPGRGPGRRAPRRSPSRSRTSSARSCPSSTTSSRSTPRASTRSTSCAPTSAPSSRRPSATEIESDFRQAVLDAAVASVDGRGAPDLVHARAHELLHQLMHSLEHRGISKEAYLQISGKDEEQLAHEAEPEAEQALKREAVLAAVVEAEGIEPTDERGRRGAEGRPPSARRRRPTKLLERLRKAGRLEALRDDLAARMAVDVTRRSRRRRSPSSRPRPATSCGRPRRSSAEQDAAGQLWTPGS